jgi:glutamate synthase domain-containing protein 3
VTAADGVTAERVETFDLAAAKPRALNELLHDESITSASYRVVNPGGKHSIAVGAVAPVRVTIEGHAGYYCAGMNQHAEIRLRGNAGTGVAENMMSGTVIVEGDASQSAGATARGGLLVIEGRASARCGISLKGGDIVVRGSVGHMSAFMAQRGRMLVCGDAGEALGDSLYEARLYIRGSVKSLGADCIEKELRADHLDEVRDLLARAGIEDCDPEDFRRYGSARSLYHFDVDHAQAY